MDKRELRQYIRATKKAREREELNRQSQVICQRVMEAPCWQSARTVLLYAALPDEVDTQRLIDEAVHEGKTVLLPVVVGDVLELRAYKGRMQEGAFGIQEPVAEGAPFTDFSCIDLVIVPGMAFDQAGHRLGRGKGYYDKLLCQLPAAYKMGICFDFQFVEEVPNEPHDISMDEVQSLTPCPQFQG